MRQFRNGSRKPDKNPIGSTGVESRWRWVNGTEFESRHEGLGGHWLEKLRGRAEILIDPPELPLTVASYVRGRLKHALQLQTALRETFPRLPQRLRDLYRPVVERAPSMVAVILRSRNVGGCLGHAHLVLSPVAKRLSDQTGRDVAEMDLALDNIREWEPRPLARLAAEGLTPPDTRDQITRYRYQLAVLSVYLHELEHIAFPDTGERHIRARSDELYYEGMEAYSKGADSALWRTAA